MSLDNRNPKLGSAAFICPHCKAFAQQRWFTITADQPKDPPSEPNPSKLRDAIQNARAQKERGEEISFPIEKMEKYLVSIDNGLPILSHDNSGHYSYWHISNVHVSTCFACEKPSVWVAGKVFFPVTTADIAEPNEDLPSDIRRDYIEASRVVLASPRAAAALLRLAIQKLCSHLLERDGAINGMIGELVNRGLSPIIQRALDIVRVVGNEAVHPGSIDLRDDQETAMQLFTLVNLITESMISQPKHVMALYGSLPPDKIAAIEQRDAKAKTTKS